CRLSNRSKPMHHRSVPLCVTITLAVFGSVLSRSGVAAPKKDMVKAQLLADTTAVKPGEPFTVGLLLDIEPDWHVYWTNPGDSGAPTTVTFKLPKGFTVGETEYPVPIKFPQPGDVVGYGYKESVLLTAKVTPP